MNVGFILRVLPCLILLEQASGYGFGEGKESEIYAKQTLVSSSSLSLDSFAKDSPLNGDFSHSHKAASSSDEKNKDMQGMNNLLDLLDQESCTGDLDFPLGSSDYKEENTRFLESCFKISSRFAMGATFGWLAYEHLGYLMPTTDCIVDFLAKSSMYGNNVSQYTALVLAKGLTGLIGGLLAQPIDLGFVRTDTIGKSMLTMLLLDGLLSWKIGSNFVMKTFVPLLNNVCVTDFAQKYICYGKPMTGFLGKAWGLFKNNIWAGGWKGVDYLSGGALNIGMVCAYQAVSSLKAVKYLFSSTTEIEDLGNENDFEKQFNEDKF
jgi:hypothetical protein